MKKKLVANYDRVRRTFITERHADRVAATFEGGEVLEIGNFWGVYFPKGAERRAPEKASKKYTPKIKIR